MQNKLSPLIKWQTRHFSDVCFSETSASGWPSWTKHLTYIFDFTVQSDKLGHADNASSRGKTIKSKKVSTQALTKDWTPRTGLGSLDHIQTVYGYIMLADMPRVSLQIDGSPHARLTGMHVSMDVSWRKRHQGLQRNVSDLQAITCH